MNHIEYGILLYGVGWIPDDGIPLLSKGAQPPEIESTQSVPDSSHIVLIGGGGEGSTGVKNAILVVRFDPTATSISHEPVAELRLGFELPYRMVVHPDGLICSFPENYSWFEWEKELGDGAYKLSVRQSDRVLEQLKSVGQQLALAFNKEGSFVTGGEDGKFRVFKWPSMEIMFTEDQAHKTVKQFDFRGNIVRAITLLKLLRSEFTKLKP